MKRRVLIVLTILMTVLSALALAEDRMNVTWPKDPVKGYVGCDLRVEVPFDGVLTLKISDGTNLWRTQTENVSAGEQMIHWDGLGEYRQELRNKSYDGILELRAENGDVCEARGKIQLRGQKISLRYAIPSSETLYLNNGPKWMVEYSLSGSGKLVMEVQQGEETVYTFKKDVNYDDCYYQVWDGTIGKNKRLAPGDYTLILYCSSDPEYRIEKPLHVEEVFANPATVGETGPIMAERGMTDEEIWEMMMKPSVVSVEGKMGHQKIFSAPSKDGKRLGEIHGQTQAVEILRITDTGWALVKAWEHDDGAVAMGYVPADKLTVVYPNEEYGILIDKKTQTGTLYERGKAVATFKVSTGVVARDKLIRETAAGSFLTEVHEHSFQSDGRTYEYLLRYDGGNLLHQAGYKLESAIKNFSAELPKIGQKASHGCVRLPPFAETEGAINAYWLWTHMPYHTRIMILDDPEERVEQARTLAKADVIDRYSYDMVTTAYEGPKEAYTPGETETVAVLTVGGDAVLGTRNEWRKDPKAYPAFIEAYGYGYPFKNLQDLFATDDMTFLNLECVLQNTNEGEKNGKLYRFRGTTDYVQILKECSVEQVNLANNHFVDFQDSGKVSTKNALKGAGIGYSGYSQLYVMEKDGHKIGFAGIRETIYNQDPTRIKEEVKKLRDMGCEAVIYSCHWGVEYEANHNENQVDMAMICAEAGVDVVIGTHPHVVQGVGNIDDTVVLWSLGNLSFGGTLELTTYDGTLARLEMIFDEKGYKGVNVTMIPVLTSSQAAENINDYCPTVAEGADRERIMKLIRDDSAYEVDGTLFFKHERVE